MASEEYKELVSLGEFKGLDFTTSDNLVGKDRGINALNANPSRAPGALMPERGRTVMGTFTNYLDRVSAVFACVGPGDAPYVLIQGYRTAAPLVPITILYNMASGFIAPLTNTLFFTKAVQYGSVVYTNAGQRFFLASIIGGVPQPGAQFYTWQYPSPAAAGNLTLGAAGGGMDAATYFYVITRTTTMPDGSVTETSVDYTQFATPPQIVLAAPGGVTITPINGLLFAGTNSDGSTFTTNLYRQGTLQAGYLFVANLATNAAYTDTSPDSAIVGNAQLVVSRDPPPVSATNMGILGIHKNRVWAFVTVSNAATLGLPQVQLWYSNVDRPWEFNSTSGVLLLQSDVTSVPNSGGTFYASLYGNEPTGLVEVGTIFLAFKKRETWGIYGDDQSSFLPRQLFNIGCVSSHSITPVVGGCFWLSENGIYYFDGSAPAYDSERVTDFLRPLPGSLGSPGSAGIAPVDQAQSCGSFSNLTFYLSFPTLQQTLGYHTVNGEWTSVLSYAPSTAAAICSTPANPSKYGGQELNEVLAARFGTAAIDWWFSDPSNDLGLPQSCSWYGAASMAPAESFEKQYRYITLVGPIQPGEAIVTLVVDPGSVPPKKVVWTIPDLTTTPRQIKSIGDGAGGALRGFMAALSVTLIGVAGKPAPQIWGVSVYGQVPPDRNLVPRT